jgi:hypothetical protein
LALEPILHLKIRERNRLPRAALSFAGMAQPPLSKAEKAQYHQYDDHRSNEPNDIVHDLSPLARQRPSPLVENVG